MPAVLVAQVPTPVFSICVADQDVPPFTYVKYESGLQQKMRLAALHQGWEVTFTVRPWPRCQAEFASGKFDALMPVAPGEKNLDAFVFPGPKGKPDPALALGSVRLVAARRLGSTVDWDGRSFTGLHGPVLYLQGLRSLSEYLTLLDAPSAGTRSSVVMIRMLLAGRMDLVVDVETRLRQTLEETGLQEGVQILPESVLTRLVYLVVSQPFYRLHEGFIERLWTDTAGLDERANSASNLITESQP